MLNLEVINKTVDEAAFSPNSFDAISIIGVLEHVPNPLELLAQCFEIVRPGGVITVVVPNMYSLLNMMQKGKSATYDGRNHLIHFSMDTLRKCFNRVGLEVVFEDTLLTGIQKVIQHIQFINPSNDDQRVDFIPEPFRSLITTQSGTVNIERFILSHGFGLRLRMLGRKVK
jgi:SAM-dependent methyltransferase